MLQLGYFCANNPQSSETFIYDLLKGLNRSQGFQLNFISGTNEPLNVDFYIKAYNTGFYNKFAKTAYRLHKFMSIKGNNSEFIRMRFNQWMALRLLKKAKIPKIDLAYVEYATTGVLLMDYFERYKIPFVIHVHGFDVTSALNDKSYKLQLTKLFKIVSKIIVASNYMRRRLIMLGCCPKKIEVINLEIPNSSIKPINWKERIKTEPSIIFLGRLTQKKSPIGLLHAFKLVQKQIPTAKLSIIGDGPLKEEVEKVIHKLDLSKSVKLYGALSREQSFPILNNHWIYAQHSVTAINGDTEGFAISLAEAALHELPVVSTIHNGIPENVIDNTTGYLVPEYDYETMAEKIIYLIKNPAIAEKMGKAGRQHIMNICEPGKRIGKIETILNQIVIANN